MCVCITWAPGCRKQAKSNACRHGRLAQPPAPGKPLLRVRHTVAAMRQVASGTPCATHDSPCSQSSKAHRQHTGMPEGTVEGTPAVSQQAPAAMHPRLPCSPPEYMSAEEHHR